VPFTPLEVDSSGFAASVAATGQFHFVHARDL